MFLLILGFVSLLSSVKTYVVALAMSFKTRLSNSIFLFNDSTSKGSWEDREGLPLSITVWPQFSKTLQYLLLNPIEPGGSQISDFHPFKYIFTRPELLLVSCHCRSCPTYPSIAGGALHLVSGRDACGRGAGLPRRLSPLAGAGSHLDLYLLGVFFGCIFDTHRP